MASLFKIPKKKQSDDSSQTHTLSPLSRLQSTTSEHKSGYGDQSSRGRTGRMHAGNTLSSPTNTQSPPHKPFFRDMVKSLLGLNSPSRRGSTANHKAAEGSSNQSQPGQRARSTLTFSNGWRPKRASDRLLQPDVTSEPESPPQKKKSDLGGQRQSQRISLEAPDSLAGLRGEEHAGSSSPSTRWATAEGKSERGNSSQSKLQKKNSSSSGSDRGSEDDFLSPCRSKTPTHRSYSSSVHRPSSSLGSQPQSSRTADRMGSSKEDARETDRQRWREFRERRTPYRSAVLQLRQKKPKETPAEPIVLSSEEEEEAEDDSDGGRVESHPGISKVQSSKGETDINESPPSILHLAFASLHVGLTHVDANGEIMVTENCISIPMRGTEEVEVSVVASQVRGYGVWDGALAQGGTLLAASKGRAPSLLFLWVSDAQANLLQMELSAIQTCAAASGPPCSFLLLVLKEQLQELQAALLASIMDMEEYREGRSASKGPASPLEWSDGLLLLHTCPPPLDQHLLRLLGCSVEKPSPGRNNRICKKPILNLSGLQQLPTRLIQYPAPPCKGRITVTKEDLACLDSGEFLNDVIIDFYLKYLLLEGVGGTVAERSHIFSSFFYKQLSRRRAAGESDVASVPDRHTRHQRVKTWTRHVDIFTKDFLFVPVNQEAHWFLVVVCFPGLKDVKYEKFQSPSGGSVSLRSPQQPECLQQAWQKDTVLKRPCILVMDSLKLSYHENVCRLLRDYLQVEWEVRRGTARLFTADTMRSSNCRVPQQDNSSDCGLYLLQYAESFLQNPVVNFDLPIRLDSWFPRQRVRQKREDIRRLIMRMHQSQTEKQ